MCAKKRKRPEPSYVRGKVGPFFFPSSFPIPKFVHLSLFFLHPIEFPKAPRPDPLLRVFPGLFRGRRGHRGSRRRRRPRQARPGHWLHLQELPDEVQSRSDPFSFLEACLHRRPHPGPDGLGEGGLGRGKDGLFPGCDLVLWRDHGMSGQQKGREAFRPDRRGQGEGVLQVRTIVGGKHFEISDDRHQISSFLSASPSASCSLRCPVRRREGSKGSASHCSRWQGTSSRTSVNKNWTRQGSKGLKPA